MTTTLTEIEIKLAYLEATQEDLNKIIITQQTAIDKLQQQINHLTTRLQQVGENDIDPAHYRPPHY
ncbi:MAG: SlyX family protein [Gammaproteobacteria bacterium]|nr:SlyX family protein [Gammaproteobacteria bacterium]